jgi:hypothetical protein
MKLKQRQPRFSFAEERFCREVLEKALKKHPLYGHRLGGRARNILIDAILDDAAAEIAREKELERDEGIEPSSSVWKTEARPLS